MPETEFLYINIGGREGAFDVEYSWHRRVYQFAVWWVESDYCPLFCEVETEDDCEECGETCGEDAVYCGTDAPSDCESRDAIPADYQPATSTLFFDKGSG